MKTRTQLMTLVIAALPFWNISQICKPELTVYFASDNDDIFESEMKKLDETIAKLQPNGSYLMEVYAYTDSDANDDYNMDLSTRRGEKIAKYMQEKYSGTFPEVSVYPKGEKDPKFDNNDPLKKKLNRRVEVVLFPMKGEKMIITGNRGTELEVNRDLFGSCPVCGSEPEIQEISTNDEAARMNLNMATDEGGSLQTGGMMMLTSKCGDTNPCIQATIRIPAKDMNPYMQIWEANDNVNGGEWTRGAREMEFIDGFYLIDIPCFGQGGRVNADVKIEAQQLITPFDVSAIVATDSTKQRVGTFDTGIPTIAGLSYAYYLRPTQVYHQVDDEGIRYKFNRDLLPRHWVNDSSDVEIPKADYNVDILLTDTSTRVKLPMNARDLALNIPAIDSVYTKVGKISSQKNQRKFNYKKPLAVNEVRVCDKNQEKCGIVPKEGLRIRFNARKKELRIRVKRSAVRNLD